MSSFTWSTNKSYWIILEDQYNGYFDNWKGPINNGQFLQQNLKEMRKTEETCTQHSGSVKFNWVSMEGKSAIPIKSYHDQCREHMIRNGIWDVFSITDPQNKQKEWDLLLRQSRLPLECVKIHVQSFLKVSKADQYIVQRI